MHHPGQHSTFKALWVLILLFGRNSAMAVEDAWDETGASFMQACIPLPFASLDTGKKAAATLRGVWQ